tara:strand:+ start:53 stop:190 length:138 start_codon:yes stop_codon:yes gene_type:complete
MTNKLYEQHDDESIDALNIIDELKREIIELKAEIATLKAQMRDMV